MANLLLIHPFTDDLIGIKDILKEAGYQVMIAEDQDTALSQVEQLHPELIICAQNADSIDGIALSQKLHLNPHTIVPFFILLTSKSDEIESLCQTHPDIDDGFSLPITKADILGKVRLGLRIYQLNQRIDKAQNQLLQNEKVLSLGQMVSGIAHEINNPVSLITGNISHAFEYTQDLLEVMQLYREKYPEPEPELQDLIEEVDLEYLMDDLPQVLNSMKSGADRIRQLVQSLRNFYRADDAEQKLTDIHAGINDILLILKGRLKGKQGQPIQVIQDYGKVPSIECYPGQINQVFMNLLNNAIDALDIQRLEDAHFEPKIWITTESIASNSQVKIRIKDNGIGIPENIKDQIFDPFFTTKTAGKGTGFGLSISHAIITETHHGTIQCLSEMGKGTEFMIEIPVSQPLK
jgi:signal transduction histidine kinase